MYDYWVEQEKVPIVTGFHIPDILEVPLGDWPRKDGQGAIVRLEGTEEVNASYVMEIAPGGQLAVQKHMYEELVYVAHGRGTTRVWNHAGHERTFEWQAGSLFAIPLNCFYQHFNTSGTDIVRFYAVNSAPLMMNLIHNDDFMFNLEYDFVDRFSGAETDFSADGTNHTGRVWDTNFIPSVHTIELQSWEERGAGGTNVMLELSNSSLCAHVSQFPVGTYKKAHRHGAGAHVVILSGEGYSLLWQGGETPRRVDWKAGSVIVPPERWFHQHFNTGSTPARYLAMRWGSVKNRVFKKYKIDQSVKDGGDQIDYADQDPSVHEMFEADLLRNGVESQMQAFFPATESTP
jgi:oxalate decarboxylase/phosphoglucose isomerase-like protein (cupin superfamily)